MTMIKIEPVQATYDAVLGKLERMGKVSYAREIMQKAIRETAAQAAGRLPEETRKKYTIKRKDFNKSDVDTSRVTRKHMESIIKVRGPVMALRAYKSRKNGKRKGASAMVKWGGTLKYLSITSGGKEYKAFFATMVNTNKNGNKSTHDGIFRRVPGSKMDEKNRPRPTKRIHRKKKRKPREAIEELLSMSRSKAAEMAFRENMHTDTSNELIYRLHKHMNALIDNRR